MDVRTGAEQAPAVQLGPHVVITRETGATVRVRATASALLPRLLLERARFEAVPGAAGVFALPAALGVVGEIHRIARAVRMLEAADYVVRHPLSLPVTGPQLAGVCAKCRAELYIEGVDTTDTWGSLNCTATPRGYIRHQLQEI